MAKYKLSKLIRLFQKFGGFRLVKGYFKLGVLGIVIKECVKGTLKRKSADEVYYAYQHIIVKAVQEQYKSVMSEALKTYTEKQLDKQRSNIIWYCWLQGIENAPSIIHICLSSLKKQIAGKDIRVVDDSNRHQLVELPEFIETKWKKKLIPPAMFADLLRLELLIKYGGTWIDSTILCTGSNYLPECLDADLFFFQFKKNENAPFAGISNWFITSCQNNVLLMALRDMLYAYWKDHDCVLEYFIFHRFFDMIAEERPDEVSKIPYAYSPNVLALGHNWGRTFKQDTWERLISVVAFHKLAYKIEDSVVKDKSNYYNYIVKTYG